MTTHRNRIEIRKALESDSAELCVILNEIIEIGGTTGYEDKFSVLEFESCFLNGDNFISCFLAENNGLTLGFQSLSVHPELPDRWADIATFTRVSQKRQGIGANLFETTLRNLKDQDLVAINATIRADNNSGLNYYTKMGFKDYSIAKEIPLQNGRLVDRISKSFVLARK